MSLGQSRLEPIAMSQGGCSATGTLRRGVSALCERLAPRSHPPQAATQAIKAATSVSLKFKAHLSGPSRVGFIYLAARQAAKVCIGWEADIACLSASVLASNGQCPTLFHPV